MSSLQLTASAGAALLIWRYLRAANTPSSDVTTSDTSDATPSDTQGALWAALPPWFCHAVRDSSLSHKLLAEGPMVLAGGLAAVFANPKVAPRFLAPLPPGSRLAVPYREGSLALLERHQHCKADIYGYDPAREGQPIVLFVHGGVWSFSRRPHYRLVAERLVRRGICVVVGGYTYYPSGHCFDQAGDVEAMIRWIHRWSTPHHPLYVAAHSSGCHVSALHLFAGLGTPSPPIHRGGEGLHPKEHKARSEARGDNGLASSWRTVAGFIGCAGVYDVTSHWHFEKSRGVHEVSPMQPACLGRRTRVVRGGTAGKGGAAASPSASAGMSLASEDDHAEGEFEYNFDHCSLPTLLERGVARVGGMYEGGEGGEGGGGDEQNSGQNSGQNIDGSHCSNMRVLFLHGGNDTVVPPSQSTNMRDALLASPQFDTGDQGDTQLASVSVQQQQQRQQQRRVMPAARGAGVLWTKQSLRHSQGHSQGQQQGSPPARLRLGLQSVEVDVIPGEDHTEFIHNLMCGLPTPFLDRILAFILDGSAASVNDVSGRNGSAGSGAGGVAEGSDVPLQARM